jgi:DMSO/TMAO reductase YedYZ molybdopterin-dependent catalytic subunit
MSQPPLPPGQVESVDFPRFGLSQFANRLPPIAGQIRVEITGDVLRPQVISSQFARLTRVQQQSDFHCVTTWSCRSLQWSGYTFLDFYRYFALPLAGADPKATFVVLRGADGFRSSLPLEDLLAPDVLLADCLNGEPLTKAHGAPLRLVAPAHYGYKSVKHIECVEFHFSDEGYRPIGYRFMSHPRARVALEERGRWFPGWLLRYVYRPLIRPTIARFERAARVAQQ